MHEKLVSLSELINKVGAHDNRTSSIVLTNGCFDPLHHGHITMLREASSLADKLVVAINSDESIRRIKGRDRPRYQLSSRVASLLDLITVDYVLVFDDDTPEEVISTLQPDFLAKGGDYSEDKIVGGAIVAGYGGKVVSTTFVPGVSSTRLTNTRKVSDDAQ